jgi:hypothetical protein
MRRIIFFFAIFFTFEVAVQAQITSDALLFSQTHQTITARSMGVGNALGALGGDLSSASLNPAGIAVYRRMEIALSVGGIFNATATNFLENGRTDRQTALSFGGIGLVLAAKIRKRRSGWKFVNFALTVNRIANYTKRFSYQGVSTGSRLQSFAENSNGFSTSELDIYEGWVAYNAYLMDSVAPFTYVANGGVSDTSFTDKYQSVNRTGGVHEVGLTLGGNYDNKLYLAATVGIDVLEMKEDRIYEETGQGIDFRSMTFTENREVSGLGINLKLGLIYRINKILRIGLAVHTPTAYRLVDSYNTGLSSEIVYDSILRSAEYLMEDQDPYVLQHNLVTPWVFMGSIGVIIAKKGFVGIDVEYTDYSWASFSLLENEKTSSNNQFMESLNRRVADSYRGVLKARIGGEVAIGLARIRLGYQFQTSPYVDPIEGVTDMRHDISVGAGVRWKHFFLDFAYNHTIRDFAYTPYSSSNTIQQITGISQTGTAMLTIGASIFRTPQT